MMACNRSPRSILTPAFGNRAVSIGSSVSKIAITSNENKISDGYRERAPIEVEVILIMENVAAQRVAVRCIVWLGLFVNKERVSAFLAIV